MSRPTDPTDTDPSLFEAVNTAFGSLGRACLALDAEFRVVHASPFLDQIGGPGTATSLVGAPIEGVLGTELFGERGRFRQALLGGERREGWRGMFAAGAQRHLVSISGCPLLHTPDGPCAPGVEYLVVVRPAEEEVEPRNPLHGAGLSGRSQAMGQVYRLLEMLHTSEATVLIEGESGTGKEVLARIIHEQSPRSHGPFVAVAPAALPAELLESELFGHVRGAFTGAVRDRVGRFEAATDGTLFLDELGELPAHLQVKLLRVLQDKTFERVGDSTPRRTEARIIAATNRNLRAEIAAGRFREDLYYRLRVVPIEVPPLRARREDIEPIARLLLARAGNRSGRSLLLSPDALRVLLSYAWPGNVRELENALEFATIVCRGQTIQPEDLPPEVLRGAGVAQVPATTAAAPAP
ncbi:MAG: sigma-54-dependent Fis family transcriptional regulator, partial [Myxococcales bacterium]|nr:sigma-54-dependent Fis family transcriptional regulator [Myxococcales bacterium]